MIKCRENAACTVFEGKIVVSGGHRKDHHRYTDSNGSIIISSRKVNVQLKSIEAYDYHGNIWNTFPSMQSPRKNHTAVTISNKIFMIGGNSNVCEVYDSVTREFTSIKILPNWIEKLNPSQTVSVGYKIYFLVGEENSEVKVHSFDVNSCVIKLRTVLNFENTKRFVCTKVSIY